MDLLSLTKELDKIVEESFGVPLQDQVNAMAKSITAGWGDPLNRRDRAHPDDRMVYEIRRHIISKYRRHVHGIDFDQRRGHWIVDLMSGQRIHISVEMASYGYGTAIETMERLVEEYIEIEQQRYPMRIQDEVVYRNIMNEARDFKFEPGMFMGIDPGSMSNVEPSKCKSCKGREHGKLDRKGRCTVTAKEDFQKTIRRLSLYRQMKNKQAVSAS